MWGLEETGGVMGPCRAGEDGLAGTGQGESSNGTGVGGLSSSDCDLRRLSALSSTYLLRNACVHKYTYQHEHKMTLSHLIL